MVKFVDVGNVSSWISETGVEPIIEGVVAHLESDFARWERFDKTPRLASHSLYGVIELMPTSDGRTYGFKYVNGHPINPKRGLQTVTAFGVLANVESGYPTFISEMTLLTALRTAATSAVAAKLLAPKDATTMAMIGTGSQSEFQALGFRTTLGIGKLRIWGTDPEAMEKLVINIKPLGFDITVASSAADAIAGAQIITTCTADKTNATILTSEEVSHGVHINAIGGDCPGKTELDAALLRRALIAVEYAPQTRIEGDLQQLEPDWPVTELWEILIERKPGRTSPRDVTVFDLVGFAIEDFSALQYLRDSIEGTNFYESLDLIAEPVDPKNLYSLLNS